MRVLYLTDSLSDLDGVGRYAMRLISALEELDPDFQPSILLSRRHRPTSSQVPAHWPVKVALPPDHFFRMSPARFWPNYLQGTWNAWRAGSGFDLVHAIKDYPHSLVALRAARLRGIPCIATAHGTYTVQPLLSQQHGRRARWAYERFAAMISVSRFTRRRMLEILEPEGFDGSRVHVVPNCVDAEHHARPREVGPQPWHGKAFTLGIGEVKERKGHHLSLGAFCRLAPQHPELHHFVVGKLHDGAYERSLRAQVKDAGLEERVHFLGNVSEDEKIDLLQRARVFVHTPVTSSDGGFEGFGIVYLEASSSGTPVLGTLDCGAEDAIVHGETGLLVAQEVEAVAAALGRLLDDEVLRKRIAGAAPAHARAANWEGNARAVHALYRKVLA